MRTTKTGARALAVLGVSFAMVLGTAAAANAVLVGPHYQSCAATQQYGVRTQVSSGNSSTKTTHTYLGGPSTDRFGVGVNVSTRPYVSSGSWEAYTPGTTEFSIAHGTCGPRVN